jgi:hypothetical protein
MVLFSKASEKDKIDAKKKFTNVRGFKVEDYQQWLLGFSSSYANVNSDPEVVRDLPADGNLDELIEDEGDDGKLILAVCGDSDRVNSTAMGIGESRESSSGMFNLLDGGVDHAPMQTKDDKPYVHVQNSQTILKSTDPIYYGAAFPHLNPYGIGTPNCKRITPVSLEAGLAHQLRMADRKYGQDTIYVLAGFNVIATKKAFRYLNVMIHARPGTLSLASTITLQEMTALMKYNYNTSVARRCGRGIPDIPQQLKSADRVLKSVESAASHGFGTNGEREDMTKTVVAFCQVCNR